MILLLARQRWRYLIPVLAPLGLQRCEMVDTFKDVPAFVAAVEANSFSGAARRLNVSRSAVGKAIARLEARLGVRLFHRTTRSQGLTDDGQAFYERCERALAELRAGQALLESGHKAASGRLRVTMPVLFGRLCVAPVLMRLAGAHPKLELDLSFGDRTVDLIEDGFDFAVRNGPLGPGSGLMSRRIARQRTMVHASPGYLEQHGRPDALADLTRHQAITYARAGRIQTWLFPPRRRFAAGTHAADAPAARRSRRHRRRRRRRFRAGLAARLADTRQDTVRRAGPGACAHSCLGLR